MIILRIPLLQRGYDLINFAKLPRPARIVEELAQVEAIVVGRVRFGVIAKFEGCYFIIYIVLSIITIHIAEPMGLRTSCQATKGRESQPEWERNEARALAIWIAFDSFQRAPGTFIRINPICLAALSIVPEPI